MFKVLASFVIAAVLVDLGCTRTKESSPKRGEIWKRGDIAVVEPSAADFFETQVLEVGNGRLKVQRLKSGESLQVGLGDAYRIPQQPSSLPHNAWAICRTRPQEWIACRTLRASLKSGSENEAKASAENGSTPEISPDGGVIVLDAMGNEHRLPAVGAVIEPTGLTAMNIQRRFEQLARRATFERSFREAGRLRRSSGWQPAPRRLVLANRGGQWFGAQVLEVDDERVVVRWDGQNGTTDLATDEVGPQPPACGPVVRGDRALRRPAGHGAAWLPVVVVGVDGPEATVEDVERVRSTVQSRDLCALGPVPASSTGN